MIRYRLAIVPAALLVAASLSWAGGGQTSDGFVSLFNGKDLSGWVAPAGDGGHWKVVDGVIDYDAASEAKGDKNLWSEREYRDFVLRLDWRIKEAPFINKSIPYILPDGSHAKDIRGQELRLPLPDADSGVFLRGNGDYQVNIWCWPIGSGEMFTIRTRAKTAPELRAAVTPRTRADLPVGQWNHFEITVKGNTVKVELNGKTVIPGALYSRPSGPRPNRVSASRQQGQRRRVEQPAQPGPIQEHRDQRTGLIASRRDRWRRRGWSDPIASAVECNLSEAMENLPMNRRIRHSIVITALAFCGFSADATIPANAADLPDKPLRALILAGQDAPGAEGTTSDLKRILAESGRFDVRICESTDGLSVSTFNPFDLVVVATSLAKKHETTKAIAAYVAAGKGVLVAQSALEPEGDCPLSARNAPRSDVRFVDVSLEETNHPIASGMSATFRTADSIPSGLTVHSGARVIATADGGNGRVPVVAISSLGQSRVAAIALGCDRSATHEPAFRALFARAGEWAATGAVTLPPVLRPSGPSPGAVKALLITGVHDHEAAFYSLFSADKDIDWLPVDTAANAFKKDLRSQYDVIIMYDFTRDLDDAGKANLRAFVESGKGVVVLHHALLNYQTWTWWSEEVVGGRYRLQREGQNRSSSVKNDQQIFVSPAGSHSILAGIHPFHIEDEAYKNLYMSPRIKPLLTTDNPTSDTNLAWIGPGEKFRVAAIQLGHGHSAFGHPSYRRLVHNAVLWAAGRTK